MKYRQFSYFLFFFTDRKIPYKKKSIQKKGLRLNGQSVSGACMKLGTGPYKKKYASFQLSAGGWLRWLAQPAVPDEPAGPILLSEPPNFSAPAAGTTEDVIGNVLPCRARTAVKHRQNAVYFIFTVPKGQFRRGYVRNVRTVGLSYKLGPAVRNGSLRNHQLST